MTGKVETIQDLASIIHQLSLINRKDNEVYNSTISSLLAILVTELARINEFLDEEGFKNLNEWELLSQDVVNTELKSFHPSVSVNELLNNKN